MGLLDFLALIEILFAVHLKHSSFWPSADVNRWKMIWRMQCPGSACLTSLCVYSNL